jgi:hypothetical protein
MTEEKLRFCGDEEGCEECEEDGEETDEEEGDDEEVV